MVVSLSSNRFKSIAINAVVLTAFLMFAHTVYETNDDHAIAKMLVEGYAYVGFVNFYLCKTLITIQSMLPGINVFVCSQIFLSYIAFTAILRIIMDRSSSRLFNVVAIALITTFAIDHYASIQFTKTSALLLTAGFLLAMNYATARGHWTDCLESLTLIVVGSAYRWSTLLPSLGFLCAFAGIYAFVTLIEGDKTKKIKEKLVLLKPLKYCVIVVIIAQTILCGIRRFMPAKRTSLLK